MYTQTKLGRCLDRLSEGMMALAMVCLGAMAVLMNVEIVARSLFKTSTMIADEYSGYFFCWLFLCALTHVQRHNGLLKVEIITNILPKPVVILLDIVSALLCALVTAILAWATSESVISSYMFGSTSLSTAETPIWIPQFIMPVGLGIVTLSFLEVGYSRALLLCGRGTNAGGAV